MELKLGIELTFSTSPDDDLFLFVKSGANNSEVDFDGITFMDVWKETEAMNLSDDDRHALRRKLTESMENFLDALESVEIPETPLSKALDELSYMHPAKMILPGDALTKEGDLFWHGVSVLGKIESFLTWQPVDEIGKRVDEYVCVIERQIEEVPEG